MDDRSWWTPEPDPVTFALPDDLRARDPFGARDCGWVNQMRPFIRHFVEPGGIVLDPFCGFGTTLVAAALEGRHGIGIDVDPNRIALAGERLARLGLPGTLSCGNLPDLPAPDRVDLCITSVPYFGCRWTDDSAAAAQLYRAEDYAAYLAGLREVFHGVRGILADGGHCIAMVENVVVGGRMIPLAWDLGRLLCGLFTPCEERILCYPARAHTPAAGAGMTNRSHEYALVFRKQREAVDLEATDAALHALAAAGFRFDVHGSFARWREHGDETGTPSPADADVIVAADQGELDRLLMHLRTSGFTLRLWGEEAPERITPESLRAHHYLRAERHSPRGALVRIDIMLADAGH